jgi:hypothetical protein
MNFLKVDDITNAKAIKKAAIKKWQKQVKEKTRLIERVKEQLAEDIEVQNEYLVEAKEGLDEAYLNIDISVRGRDNIGSYLGTYESQIAMAKAQVERVEDTISGLNSTVEAKVERANKEVANYKENIKAIS